MGDGGIGLKGNGRRARKQDTGRGGIGQGPFRALVGEVIGIVAMHRGDGVRVIIGKEGTGAGLDFEFGRSVRPSWSQEYRASTVREANLAKGLGLDLVHDA